MGGTGLAHSRLPPRLASLQELTKIGSGRTGSEGFRPELLTQAETLLRRAGEPGRTAPPAPRGRVVGPGRRSLVRAAGHHAVTTVVLNQVDTLSPDQAADCESDLRRLLDAEGLSETQVLVTSATTGAGLNELRRALAGAVAARRAASDRITADIDALLERFAVYAGDSVPGWLSPMGPGPTLSAAPATETAPADQAPAQASARPPWEQADADE